MTARHVLDALAVELKEIQKREAAPASIIDQIVERRNVVRARKFDLLRRCLHALDIDQAYLAKELGYSRVTVSNKMTGKIPWTMWDMQKVMALIQEPWNRVHEIFPPNGEMEHG